MKILWFLQRNLLRALIVILAVGFVAACNDDDSPSGPGDINDTGNQPGVLANSNDVAGYPTIMTDDVEGIYISSEILTTFGLGGDPVFPSRTGLALLRGEGRDLSSTLINGFRLSTGTLNGWSGGLVEASIHPQSGRFKNDGVQLHSFYSDGHDDAPIFFEEVRSIDPIELTYPVKDQKIDKNSDLTVRWSDPDPTGDYYYGLNVYVAAGAGGYNVFLDKSQLSHTVPKRYFQTVLNNENGVRIQISKLRYVKRVRGGKNHVFAVNYGIEPVFEYED